MICMMNGLAWIIASGSPFHQQICLVVYLSLPVFHFMLLDASLLKLHRSDILTYICAMLLLTIA